MSMRRLSARIQAADALGSIENATWCIPALVRARSEVEPELAAAIGKAIESISTEPERDCPGGEDQP